MSEATYEYDDYGETVIHNMDEENPIFNEVCYTCGIYDETTGLYNLNGRYYDAESNTFLTQDTYRGERNNPNSLNLYSYCEGDPITYIDPSGHWVSSVIFGALGAYDGYKYAKKKNLKGAKKAAAIVGGAILGAVNPFKVVKTAKTGYKAYKVAKVTKVASTAKKTTTVAKALTKKSKTVSAVTKVVKKVAKPKTVKSAKTVAKKAAKKGPGCFVKGTKVHTKGGFKAIDKIRVGDHVWSENPETNEKALKKVKKIFVREKDSIIRLSINGEVIKTTDEHPFYKEGVGFVPAKSLEVGDRVRLEDETDGIVESTETIHLGKPIKVYNFEVEDYHTYYVSEAKVLVHNTCAATVKNTVQKVAKRDETVWKNIKPTQENHKLSSIPKSFELSTNHGKVWVHPHATKHMLEYAGKKETHGKRMIEQQLLTELHDSVNQMLKNGYTFNESQIVNRWELTISRPGVTGPLPVLMHAVFRP